MVEYQCEFVVLANRAEGLSDDAVLDYFISGLKLDLRPDVLAQTPMMLVRAVTLA